MLVVTRERLIAHLLDLGSLADLYQQRAPTYLPAAINWLANVERTLQELRHPLAGVVSSERGLILAAADGWKEPEIVSGQRQSLRKIQRATAARVLARVAEQLERTISSIDVRFEMVRDKVAQLLAVASVVEPLPLAQLDEPRSEWLRRLWEGLILTNETQSMYAYLNSALPHHDLMCVLGDTVDNMLGIE